MSDATSSSGDALDPETGSVSDSMDAVAGKGRPTRFRASDASDLSEPTWFRLLFPIVTLAVAVILLAALLLWLVFGIDSRPDLLAFAVEKYDNRAIPITAFADREVAVLRTSPGLNPLADSESRVQNSQDFDLFLQQRLKAAQHETLVVYLALQGVTDEHGAYMLLAGSNPDPASGYPVGRLLEHLANHSAQNVLLVLNVAQTRTNLDLGVLGNDFAAVLKDQFEQIRLRSTRRGQSPKNFWVLCSANDGQQSHASASLGWNAFGLACAYGLHGGRLADDQGEDDQADGRVTAGEFCRFVTDRVSRWASKTMKRDQSPWLLKIGEDFPLVDAASGVYPDEFLQATGEVVAQQLASTEPSKDSQQQPEQPAESTEPEKAADAGPPEPVTTRDVEMKARKTRQQYWQGRYQVERVRQIARDPRKLVYQAPPITLPFIGRAAAPSASQAQIAQQTALMQTLWEIWTVHHNLDETEYLHHPAKWHYFQQLILYAEELLLARRFTELEKLVDEDLPAALEAMQAQQSESNWVSWSLARPGTLSLQQQQDRAQAIRMAIAEPSDANLAALEKFPCSESDLLIRLGKRLRENGVWTWPGLVRFAVETRTLGEQAAFIENAALRAQFGDRVRAADALRRRGEVELLLQRPSRSQTLLEQATIEYQSILTELSFYRTALASIQSTTANVPYLLRWLGEVDDVAAPTEVQHAREKLMEFLVARQSDANRLERGAVHRMAQLAREIRQASIDFAENAWQHDSEPEIRAAMHLPYLPTELRQRLLSQLIAREPVNPLTVDTFPVGSSEASRLANPYPLEPVVLFATGSETLANQYREWSPLRSEPITWADVQAKPELRRMRARLGDEVREIIYRLGVDPGQVQATATPILPDRARLLAACVALRQAEPAADDPYHSLVQRTVRAEEVAWQIERASEDAIALELQPVSQSPQSQSLAILGEAAASLSPGLWPPDFTTGFLFKSGAATTIQEGKQTQVELEIQVTADHEDVSATLVLDWQPDSRVVAVTSPAAAVEDARLAVPIASLRSGDVLRIPVVLEGTAPVESMRPLAVTARIESSDGRVQWLPLQWKLAPLTPLPAELTLAWQERAGLQDQLDLFPNQQMEVQVKIRKNIKPALNLRVEILNQGARLAVLPVSLPADFVGNAPLKVAAPLALTARRGPFTLRLYDQDRLLDEKELRAAVLDPLKFFECHATFDSDTGKVTAQVTRTGVSDSEQPVTLALEVNGLVLDQGILQDVLTEERTVAVLQAQLPVEFTAPQFEAHVGVAGAPRLFRFLLGLEYPTGVPVDRLDLRLADPQPGTVFLASDQPTSPVVSLLADGPDELRLRFGIDRNENGEIDSADARSVDVYWMGKAVEIRLEASPEQETFTVSNRVGDLKLPLPANRLLGSQRILAILEDGTSARLEFPLYFVDAVPAVSISAPLPATPVAQGDLLPVTVKGDPKLFRAVTKLEFGFDKNGNARFEDDEAVQPDGVDPSTPLTFQNSHLISVSLPTKDLPVGPMTLMVRATTLARDIADATKTTTLTGKLQRRAVEIRPASESPILSAPGTVKGVALANDRGAARVRVTLEGTNLVAITDDDGRFRISDVPSGAYNVVAQSYNRVGRQVVVVQPGKESEITVYMSLR